MSSKTLLFAAFLFAFGYTQATAIYSNQNQYYLHAFAQAGHGMLAEDWLANTADPTPIFTRIIAFCYQHLGMWFLDLVFFLALMVYFLAIWKIIEAIHGLPQSICGQWLFAAFFTLSHAAIARYASDRLLGADYFWFLQCGLANQYLLGPGLQPSVCGVLLLVSIVLFLQDRPVLASALAAGSTLIHTTYLLPAAFLVSGYLLSDVLKGRPKVAFASAIVALLVALPVVIYTLVVFGPTSAESFAEAQRILKEVRIPHHAEPARWFDIAGAAQLLLIAVGWLLLRATPLMVTFSVSVGFATLGSILVLLTDNATLALLFPWRISAVFIPVCTAVLLAWISRGLDRFPRLCCTLASVMLLITTAGAIAIYAWDLGYREPASEEAVMKYVASTAKPGDCYLIPARFPRPNPPAGVYANTFTAPPDADAIVYFELARFRLATGAPLFVDFKSIPYKDADVLEWHRRVALCVRWFSQENWTPEVIKDVRSEGITHVVAPKKMKLESPQLEQLHEAGAYIVYRLKPKPGAG